MASTTKLLMGGQDISCAQNTAKEPLLEALEKCGLLREGITAESLSATFTIVINEKGILGKVWNRVRGIKDEDEMVISILTDPLRLKNVLDTLNNDA